MKKPIFDYNRITPLIYIGTNQCCVVYFDKRLLKKGIKADISLEMKKIDAPFGVEYYIWLPTKNHFAPSLEKLKLGVLMLSEFERMRIKTFVHCELGHGRAPTLVAAYLISKGMTAKEAVAFVKKRRSVIHLTARQDAALRKFEKMYRK